ncbi:RNA-directed DNA polymerase, eukaryota, reverse transcriptase zinc-binding domain protein [Tanacetum coccineum]|uniref:RNA-directed DNA polymerase, eukaryota, reverse transcriptase zinc-binding domain protein n=1 Tax=Tanacetum coccineum TaxID=301880 RepID=A0ABQ4XTE0_9ASTR
MEGCENTLASLVAGDQMNCLSINVQGFGDLNKRRWVRDLCNLYKVNFLAIQETKMLHVDLWLLRQVCGNSNFDFASSSARGLSGGNVHDGIVMVMGDFNEVRVAGERFGSVFNDRQAKIFNEFILDASLIDILLGVVLEKSVPDHRPILLKKLQNLKQVIRKWVALKKSDSFKMKKEYQQRLSSIDAKVDQGLATKDDILLRKDSLTLLGEIERMEAKDLAQKAKIKWALEGDENTTLNPLSTGQRDSLETPITRVEIKKAVWDCGGDHAPGLDGFTFKFFTTFWDLIEEDVIRFVQEFFHSNIFPKGCNSSFIALIPKVPNAKNCIGSCTSPVQSAFLKGRNILDGPIILNEVMSWYRRRKKDLVVFKVDFEKAFDSLRWDYLDLVLDKLGFGFKWRSWISGCLTNVRSSVLINGSPTAEFELFRGLRQGDLLSPFLFILAMEGLHAFTTKAEEIGLFRGASIGRDNMSISHLMYADDVIFFGEWSWLNAHHLICMLRCFYLISGLKINVRKSNVLGIGVSDNDVTSMANIIGCGAASLPMKYLGVPVGCNMSRCSNWNTIIKKFSSKLSSWKARLLSVGGRLSLIKSVLGNLPTYYLSIYLMLVTVRNKLESMRNKFFIGGDQEDIKVTWVNWKKCMASREHGGLGIGSIFGLNVGLLFKWIWRFLNHPSSLWACVIQSLYGADGGINSVATHRSMRTTWGAILHSIFSLKQQGMDLLSLCTRNIGNGISTWFWEDTWCGNQPLKIQFPRIYLLDTYRNCSIASRVPLVDWSMVLRRNPRGGSESAQFNALKDAIGCVSLSDKRDSWIWSLDGCNSFSVASVCNMVDSQILDVCLVATHWNRLIPIKVNVFLWRLKLNRLPSRVNLDRKGIDIGSIRCPKCLEDIETVNHIFFNCGMAQDLWALLAKWWELDFPLCANITEWYDWLDSSPVPSKARLVLEGVGGTLLWSIWIYRNHLLFTSPPPKKSVLWDSIVSKSFLWISSRNPKFKCSWVCWLQNNLLATISSL